MVGPLSEQQQSFLHKIRRGVDNITAMVSDLLDLGRIEAEARMEMAESSDAYYFQLDLPGVKRDSLELETVGDELRLNTAVTARVLTHDAAKLRLDANMEANYLSLGRDEAGRQGRDRVGREMRGIGSRHGPAHEHGRGRDP